MRLCPCQILEGDIICGSISGIVGICGIAFIDNAVLSSACDRCGAAFIRNVCSRRRAAGCAVAGVATRHQKQR